MSINKYYIKIGDLYFGGEDDGYYKGSKQQNIFGGYRAWSGEMGVNANAPSGLGKYKIVDKIEEAQYVLKCSIGELITNIIDRQNYGFIPNNDITITEVK